MYLDADFASEKGLLYKEITNLLTNMYDSFRCIGYRRGNAILIVYVFSSLNVWLANVASDLNMFLVT